MSDKVITIDGTAHELSVERDGDLFRAGGEELELGEVRGNLVTVRHAGRTVTVPFVVTGSTVSFAYDGEIYSADVAEKGARARVRHRDQSMSAPMPSLVLKVFVAAGAAVEKGMPLVILEAMKMEHTIVAPRDGTVSAVHCREGELVQPGVELVEMAEKPEPGA